MSIIQMISWLGTKWRDPPFCAYRQVIRRCFIIMDSFISWIGGKKLLRKEICGRFPEDIEKYVEVFGGAA